MSSAIPVELHTRLRQRLCLPGRPARHRRGTCRKLRDKSWRSFQDASLQRHPRTPQASWSSLPAAVSAPSGPVAAGGWRSRPGRSPAPAERLDVADLSRTGDETRASAMGRIPVGDSARPERQLPTHSGHEGSTWRPAGYETKRSVWLCGDIPRPASNTISTSTGSDCLLRERISFRRLPPVRQPENPRPIALPRPSELTKSWPSSGPLGRACRRPAMLPCNQTVVAQYRGSKY